MDAVTYTIRSRRNGRIIRVVFAALFLLVAILLVSSLVSSADWAAVSATLANNNELTNVFIGSVLVFITAVYSLITYATLAELRRSRRNLTRPLLSIALSDFERSESPFENHIGLLGELILTNVGRGDAIDVRVDLSAKMKEGDARIGSNWITVNRQSDGKSLSNLRCATSIQPGACIAIPVRTSVTSLPVEVYTPDFMMLSVSLEDVEGNLLHIKQFFRGMYWEHNRKVQIGDTYELHTWCPARSRPKVSSGREQDFRYTGRFKTLKETRFVDPKIGMRQHDNVISILKKQREPKDSINPGI